MSYTFRNQLIISKHPLKQPLKRFTAILINNIYIYYSNNIPMISHEKLLVFGWAWSCKTGKKIDIDTLKNITPKNYLEKTKDFSGRFILIYDAKYLFTDATSSYPIYYSKDFISTNISLLCHIKGIKPKIEKEYRKKLILPPLTFVKNISRLIPGEYLELETISPVTIKSFFKIETANANIDLKLTQISQYLIICAKGLRETVNNDFRLMLTSGKDSRLSLISLYTSGMENLKTMTHLKPFFFNDINDYITPKKIAKILNISHQFTIPIKKNSINLSEVQEQNRYLALEQEPGSTYFYYKYGNWPQINEKFLIDNYYEIGRQHLHKKGLFVSSESFSLDVVLESGYITNKDAFKKLHKHVLEISKDRDILDIFYFIKNYINVANQFELIDYSHNPLMFCNSLGLFRQLLDVPSGHRKNGKFHNLLLENMTPQKIKTIPCNRNSTLLFYKIIRKIQAFFMQKIYR